MDTSIAIIVVLAVIAFVAWGLIRDMKLQKARKEGALQYFNKVPKASGFMASFFVVAGGLVAILGIGASNGAPQEAAAASIALCVAVIPYLLFKIEHCLRVERNQIEILKAINSKTSL